MLYADEQDSPRGLSLSESCSDPSPECRPSGVRGYGEYRSRGQSRKGLMSNADVLHNDQVSERYGDREKALDLFNEAVRLSPDNALVRYRRAKILISLKRYRVSRDDFFSSSVGRCGLIDPRCGVTLSLFD